MRRILIVNAYGHSNRGDSVLLDECVSELRERFPDAEIGIALYEGETQLGKRLERIGNASRVGGPLGKLETLVYLAAAKIGAPLRQVLPVRQRETLEFMDDADLVVSAPGGYIHDTNAAWIVALAQLQYALDRGKRVWLAPQSYGPLRSDAAAAACRRVLSKCEYVCVRERQSYDFLVNRVGLDPAIIVRTGDSAFWNYPEAVEAEAVSGHLRSIGLEDGERFVGGTVVDWSFPHEPGAETLARAYAEKMAWLFRQIHQEHGLRTVIFNQVDEDRAMMNRVKDLAGDAVLIQKSAPESNILRGMMARSETFVGTRFHSCIFAMMGGVPTSAISYLPKTTGIMQDLEMKRCTPINDVDEKSLLAWASQDLQKPLEARQELARKLDAYRASFSRFGDLLKTIS